MTIFISKTDISLSCEDGDTVTTYSYLVRFNDKRYTIKIKVADDTQDIPGHMIRYEKRIIDSFRRALRDLVYDDNFELSIINNGATI
jgi:hypothetical protein